LDISRNKERVRGSIILMGSLSHMRRVGTEGYYEDLCWAAKLTGEANGGKVIGGGDIKYFCRRYPISYINIVLSDIGKKICRTEGLQSDIGSIR
jgi:hypothetical protein